MLLFDPPLDFDPKVLDEYRNAFPVVFPQNTYDSEDIGIWVVDPLCRRVIDDEVLEYYTDLKILATPSTGRNHIDLEACERRGIKVLSLLDDRAGLETISASAEFTFKLLLDALRIPPAHELQGKMVGLVGHGRIGKRIQEWVHAFGGIVNWIYDPPRWERDPLDTMFNIADAVVVCCEYNKSTHHLITGDLLRLMPEGAVLVNTARGEVIDEDELVKVMGERPDLRVAVDVLEGETTGTAQPDRLKARGAIVTPHIAGETFESRTKAARIILELLKKTVSDGTAERTTPAS